MMDDVLVANLPPALLRSSVRTLLSHGTNTHNTFVEHVRKRLLDMRPPFIKPHNLFPRNLQSPEEIYVSQDCLQYMSKTRCLFASKLVIEAFPYLSHFINAVVQAVPHWTAGDDLDTLFCEFDGDVVQAVQALKESLGFSNPNLKPVLQDLNSALNSCRVYCAESNLPFPFRRSARQVKDVYIIIEPGSPTLSSTNVVARDQRHTLNLQPSLFGVPIEKVQIGSFEMPRLFSGLWQLSSPAWGFTTAETQRQGLLRLVENGFTTTDMADHYGDAELVYGEFRNLLPDDIQHQVYAATKWCIFQKPSDPISHEWVLDAVRERYRRLGGRVELLQFHWYDYTNEDYLNIVVELVKISQLHPDLVSNIGLCNFNSLYTERVCEHLKAELGSVGIVSNQVQLSLLDTRPLQRMSSICHKYGIKLLTYGSLCGGLISSEWIHRPEPESYSESFHLTPSQRKYLDMISTWGNWSQFQELLRVLSEVAQKHNVSITNVATRWVLQQPNVGAVIVGTRLGLKSHVHENLQAFSFSLDKQDIQVIEDIALGADQMKSSNLFKKIGDCGDEYRK